jgi:ABC-2 type transport system permease protein
VALAVLLATAFGAVALLVGCATGRRAAGIGAAVGLALASYLLNSLGSLTEALEPWRPLSLFRHASPADALSGDASLGGAAVVAAVTAVLVAAAITLFDRRDLRA